MVETVSFIFRVPVFCFLAFLVNISLGYELAKALNSRYRDAVIAASGKAKETSFMQKLRSDALKLFNNSDRKGFMKRFTEKAKQNMERAELHKAVCGIHIYCSEICPPIVIFLLTWVINFLPCLDRLWQL